jgi:hypothetical protein
MDFVNMAFMQSIVRIPSCVLDTSALKARVTLAMQEKEIIWIVTKVNDSNLGLFTKGFEISAVQKKDTEKER